MTIPNGESMQQQGSIWDATRQRLTSLRETSSVKALQQPHMFTARHPYVRLPLALYFFMAYLALLDMPFVTFLDAFWIVYTMTVTLPKRNAIQVCPSLLRPCLGRG